MPTGQGHKNSSKCWTVYGIKVATSNYKINLCTSITHSYISVYSNHPSQLTRKEPGIIAYGCNTSTRKTKTEGHEFTFTHTP